MNQTLENNIKRNIQHEFKVLRDKNETLTRRQGARLNIKAYRAAFGSEYITQLRGSAT